MIEQLQKGTSAEIGDPSLDLDEALRKHGRARTRKRAIDNCLLAQEKQSIPFHSEKEYQEFKNNVLFLRGKVTQKKTTFFSGIIVHSETHKKKGRASLR